MMPENEQLCLARLRELIDEGAAVPRIRRILALPAGRTIERRLVEDLARIEQSLSPLQRQPVDTSQLTGKDIIVRLIIREVLRLNVAPEKLRTPLAWLEQEGPIPFALEIIACGRCAASAAGRRAAVLRDGRACERASDSGWSACSGYSWPAATVTRRDERVAVRQPPPSSTPLPTTTRRSLRRVAALRASAACARSPLCLLSHPRPPRRRAVLRHAGLWSLRRREVAVLGASDKARLPTRPSGHAACTRSGERRKQRPASKRPALRAPLAPLDIRKALCRPPAASALAGPDTTPGPPPARPPPQGGSLHSSRSRPRTTGCSRMGEGAAGVSRCWPGWRPQNNFVSFV